MRKKDEPESMGQGEEVKTRPEPKVEIQVSQLTHPTPVLLVFTYMYCNTLMETGERRGFLLLPAEGRQGRSSQCQRCAADVRRAPAGVRRALRGGKAVAGLGQGKQDELQG